MFFVAWVQKGLGLCSGFRPRFQVDGPLIQAKHTAKHKAQAQKHSTKIKAQSTAQSTAKHKAKKAKDSAAQSKAQQQSTKARSGEGLVREKKWTGPGWGRSRVGGPGGGQNVALCFSSTDPLFVLFFPISEVVHGIAVVSARFHH